MIKKIFLFLIASFVAVLFFELFLRFSPFSYGVSPVEYDKEIGMWHKRDFSSKTVRKCYDTTYFFDNKGLVKNSYEYNINKKDVVLLGDSYTEAIMVQNRNVLHNSLQREYGGEYNFLNYGLSGTASVQHLVMLQKKVDFKNVKEVIQLLNMDGNIYEVDPKTFDSTTRPKVFLDFSDMQNYRVIPPKPLDTKEKIRDFLGDFELYIYLRKILYFIKGDKSDRVDIGHTEDENLSKNWLQVKGAISNIQKLLKEKSIKYKVIVYGRDLKLKKTLIKFLIKQKIEFYNLESLSKKYSLPLKSFSCDRHWSDEAHQNIAKIIKKENII
jgi:hypothetical protein